ncbi:hypothetical protein [Variovorax sp. UC122_21]|jgi:transposase|uniref:hypothetical protein n=1 Tax=unclassified Variovorax TaxID=663243 RepID=UPI003757B137
MAEYREKQKLAAVMAYRKGAGELRATASTLTRPVGKLGLLARERANSDVDSKLEVLHRMQDEGLSGWLAAALFNIRPLSLTAEWNRAYAAHGAPALQPGWK